VRGCEFTHLLPFVRQSRPMLDAHLKRCDSCSLAAHLLLTSDAQPDAPTQSCPDDPTLLGYAVRWVERDEETAIAQHVLTCAHCLKRLQLARPVADEPAELDESLASADRELRAYLLTKDIAQWLAAEEYPDEAEVVASTFDTVYAALASPDISQPASAATSLALGFSGTASSAAGRLIATAALAAHCLVHAESLPAAEDAFKERASGVRGFPTNLTAAAIHALRHFHTPRY